MLNSYIVSLIRTGIPLVVGYVLTWVNLELGIVIDERSSAQVIAGVVAAMTGAFYALARALEARWPVLGWLLGVQKAPMYGKEMPVLVRATVDKASVRQAVAEVHAEIQHQARPPRM